MTGFVPSLDLAEWHSLPWLDADTGPSMLFDIHSENLNVGRLLWRGEELGKLNLSLQSAGDSVAAQFDLPWLSGDFSQAAAAPLTESDAGFDTALLRNLDLAFIDLDGLPTLGEQLTDPSPPDPERGIGQWIRGLPVSIQAIRLGDTDLGDIKLVIDYADAQGWQFKNISGNFLGIEWLPATHIVWRDHETESTTLIVRTTNDIATSLQLLGVPPSSRRAVAAWMHSGSGPKLADFDLHAVSGDFHLEMQTGSFDGECRGDGSKACGLLNLSGLFRRANMNQLST